MRELKRDELLTMISLKSGVTKKDAEKVLKSLGFIVYNSLIRGFTVRVPEIGKFELRVTKARTEERFFERAGFRKETMVLKPRPEYCRPVFSFVNGFKEKIKTGTMGRLIKEETEVEDNNG